MRPLRANCEVLLSASNSQSGGWNRGMISADLREEEAESGFAPSPCCPPRGKHREAVQKRASPALPGKPLAACQPNWVNTTPRSLSLSHMQSISRGFGNICPATALALWKVAFLSDTCVSNGLLKVDSITFMKC